MICQTHCLHNIITNPPPIDLYFTMQVSLLCSNNHHGYSLPAKIISPSVPCVIHADLISYNKCLWDEGGGVIQAIALVQDYS